MSARTVLMALAVLLSGCLLCPPTWAAELYLITDENGVLTITDSPPAATLQALPQSTAQSTAQSAAQSAAQSTAQSTAHGPRRPRPPRGYTSQMDRFDGLIHGVANRYSISPALLKAMCIAESGMNPLAVSRHGALGLMQLMPTTARALDVVDPFDPGQSLAGGARYLAGLLEQFGAVEQAIAAYNSGPARVREAGGVPAIPETEAFVARVLGLYRFFLDEHPLVSGPDS